jgi:hypothetical protein
MLLVKAVPAAFTLSGWQWQAKPRKMRLSRV